MTPNDIATDVTEFSSNNAGSITQTATGTQSFVGGRLTIDDWNNWG